MFLEIISEIVSLVAERPLSGKAIQDRLPYPDRSIQRALDCAVATGALRRLGEKRSTRYALP